VAAAVAGVLLFSLLALTAARVLAGHKNLPRWLVRFGLSAPAENSRPLLSIAVLNFLAWIVYGSAHWALARSILPVALTDLPSVAGASALAWAGGYLAIVMPAGIGVREGLLVLLLAPMLGAGPVAVLAAGIRLLSLGVDLSITAVWIWKRTPSQDLEATQSP
jgi:hypothetical protein